MAKRADEVCYGDVLVRGGREFVVTRVLRLAGEVRLSASSSDNGSVRVYVRPGAAVDVRGSTLPPPIP